MLKRLLLLSLAMIMALSALSLSGCRNGSDTVGETTDNPPATEAGVTTDAVTTGVQEENDDPAASEIPGVVTPMPEGITDPIPSYAEMNMDESVPSVVPDGFVNALDYGVKTDTKNCSNQLRSCISNYGKVFLPRGDYYITANVYLKDNVEICGEEGTVIHISRDTDLFTAKGQFNSKTEPATRIENITIRNLTVVSDTPINNYVLKVISGKNITVDNVRVSGLGLIHVTVNYQINSFDGTEDPSLTGGVFSDDCLSENVKVSNCTVNCGSTTSEGANGIYLCFVNHAEVTNCHIRNCYQGIEFWGGDSYHERGGLLQNRKNVKNGYVYNCSVFDAEGGIWSSLGENIEFSHCEAARCNDIGFDFEGTNNAKCSLCKVYDCGNGNFSTFQYCCGTVEFCYNESYLTGEHHQHYFNSNPAVTIAEQSVTFHHNKFFSEELSRLFVASELRDFIFTKNTCNNTVINAIGNNNLSAVANLQITDNTFRFTVPTDSEKQQVILAASRQDVDDGVTKNLIVSGNTITCEEGVTAKIGIRILHDRYYQVIKAVCADNNISGCTTGIMLHNVKSGANAGTLQVEVKNNITESMRAQGENITYELTNNKNASGQEVTMQVRGDDAD